MIVRGGWGGDVNVRVERFHHVTEEAHVGYVVVWSWGGVGGWVGMLTFVSSASITLRKRHMLHMLSYDRKGGWGDVNVRVEHFLYVTQEVAVADILHCLTRFLRISCVNLCWSWSDCICIWSGLKSAALFRSRWIKNGTVMLTAGLGVTTLPCYRL